MHHTPISDATCKMCGTPDDNSIPIFKLLDEALLPMIQIREKPTCQEAGLPEVPIRWTLRDADVACSRLEGQTNSNGAKCTARREHREKTEDWVNVALSDLVEERDYLRAYGVKGYLPKSIAKVGELAKEARPV
ncbi:hypothetical protein B0T10DRAFT_236571 [Thelonectria olida]|uniref:Uncharacterized protein n=1 Tax=Thelonectria olida TaxID=1576542 RepID=A0A9P8VRS1_9HYPO|nr:hypothetical protein B0T10DRAFT_236571 [Thelonectria olida]